MPEPGLRTALRFDGAAWRRFAELGCVYGPEWWKRGSPPVIAAIIYAIARAQRAAVLANQRQVRGARGWLRERWDAYRVFAEFARSVTEGFEQWGSRPPPLEFCGRTTRFQLGPFAVARVARAPIVPVFAVRTGIRRYEIRIVGRFDPRTPAESVAALGATVRAYEATVRAHPAQWLMFEPVWRPEAETSGEAVSGAAAVGSGQR